MGRQAVRGGNNTAVRADELRSAANNLAHTLRVDGLTGPAEAYLVIGYLGLLTKATQEVMSAVEAWLQDEQQGGRLTVREGPFMDEPEAALAVVADALTRASAASARSHTELERAHIASADIGAISHQTSRPSLWRP